MGKDDLFKKRKETRVKRKSEFKKPKANSYLIVCEGQCSEPYYFEGIREQIENKIGGYVEVVEVPDLEICGKGCSTCKLIEKTDEIVNRSKVMYQQIWVLFDKDDFLDFDKAIEMGKKKGYHVGWSNPCFEYWLYLHFYYSDSALGRHQYVKKLDEIFKQKNIGNGSYEKNLKQIYSLVDIDKGVEKAITNAEKIMLTYEKTDKPSACMPATTVHALVKSLNAYILE